jgi:hypothetical protein
MSRMWQRATALFRRDDRQPGVRHDRAGSDAGISLEAWRAVSRSRMRSSTASP